MMMFIPLSDIYKNDNEFQTKIQFNHKKYIGEETLFCTSGFNNLNTLVKLKNGQSILIRHLLKSIPASTGMSWPQLFQHAEPNPGAMVTIVTFQASDRELVHSRRRNPHCYCRWSRWYNFCQRLRRYLVWWGMQNKKMAFKFLLLKPLPRTTWSILLT